MHKDIILIAISLISIIINIIVYSKIKKVADKPKDIDDLKGQLKLLELRQSKILEEINQLHFNLETTEPVEPEIEVKEVDELTRYVTSGMSIADIAKRLNKSVKEVELILRMRGLQ